MSRYEKSSLCLFIILVACSAVSHIEGNQQSFFEFGVFAIASIILFVYSGEE